MGGARVTKTIISGVLTETRNLSNVQFRGPPPQNNNFRGPHPQNPQQPIRPQHIQDGPIRPQHIQEVPPKLEGPPVFAVPTTAPSKPMPMEISQPRSIDEAPQLPVVSTATSSANQSTELNIDDILLAY